jgi:hypothetical protein
MKCPTCLPKRLGYLCDVDTSHRSLPRRGGEADGVMGASRGCMPCQQLRLEKLWKAATCVELLQQLCSSKVLLPVLLLRSGSTTCPK